MGGDVARVQEWKGAYRNLVGTIGERDKFGGLKVDGR
jgi:hypothetical protein